MEARTKAARAAYRGLLRPGGRGELGATAPPPLGKHGPHHPGG